MKLSLRSLLMAIAVVTLTLTAFAVEDLPGSKDYPGLTRLQGYHITRYQEWRFDTFTFRVTEAGKEKKQAVEGHRYAFRFDYDTPGNASKGQIPSAVEVMRNYQNAARAVGGKVVFEVGEGVNRDTTVKITKANQEVWISLHVISFGGVYYMDIVEKQAMQQEVTLDAAAMAGGLKDSGSVAIYGIYFDTAKSDLKPESDAAIDEIAKLLTNDPMLNVDIVGHTDMVGDAASNLKLSQARAQAVVTGLISKHGIAATRLVAFGVGSYAPVATNKTEEGRAKHRRVELVEIATK